MTVLACCAPAYLHGAKFEIEKGGGDGNVKLRPKHLPAPAANPVAAAHLKEYDIIDPRCLSGPRYIGCGGKPGKVQTGGQGPPKRRRPSDGNDSSSPTSHAHLALE